MFCPQICDPLEHKCRCTPLSLCAFLSQAGKVFLLPSCFDNFFGSCFEGQDEASLHSRRFEAHQGLPETRPRRKTCWYEDEARLTGTGIQPEKTAASVASDKALDKSCKTSQAAANSLMVDFSKTQAQAKRRKRKTRRGIEAWREWAAPSFHPCRALDFTR